MLRGYCLHCGAVEMTDNGCLMCGGGCGRVATDDEIKHWEDHKKVHNLTWDGLTFIQRENG